MPLFLFKYKLNSFGKIAPKFLTHYITIMTIMCDFIAGERDEREREKRGEREREIDSFLTASKANYRMSIWY